MGGAVKSVCVQVTVDKTKDAVKVNMRPFSEYYNRETYFIYYMTTKTGWIFC